MPLDFVQPDLNRAQVDYTHERNVWEPIQNRLSSKLLVVESSRPFRVDDEERELKLAP